MNYSAIECFSEKGTEHPACTATVRAPGRKWSRLGRTFAVRVVSVLLCLCFWQTASMRKWDIIVRFQNIPAPTEVGRAAVRLVQSPKLISHVRNSLMRIFAGFAIATVSAIPLGLLIGRFPLAGDALLTPLEVLRPIPAVAWIPLAILMFPNAEGSMIYITFVGAFFPILLSTIHGVHSIDRRFVSAAMTLGAGPFTVFSEVLSIGMGTSWFSLVTAEMISGQFGIGYYTWEAYTLQNYPDILLGMIAIGLLGMASSLLVKKAGGWFMPWFRPQGTET